MIKYRYRLGEQGVRYRGEGGMLVAYRLDVVGGVEPHAAVLAPLAPALFVFVF